jgi:hypothetical protein
MGHICRLRLPSPVRSRPPSLISKIAAVSDSTILSIAPQLTKHFVKAEIRHFNANERATAVAWLRE